MKTRVLKVLLTCILLYSSSLIAQEKWSLELQPNFNLTANDEFTNGYGGDISITYKIANHLGINVGWSWNKFKSDNELYGDDFDLEETGYHYGILFKHPLTLSSKTSYVIKVNGIYHHLEIENPEGDIVNDTKHGFGWQAGAGLNFDLKNKWYLTPNITYQSLSSDIKIPFRESSTYTYDMQYFKFGFSIGKYF